MHVVRPHALNVSGLFSFFFLLSIFLFYTIFYIRPIFCVDNFCSCNEVALRVAMIAIIAAAVVAAIMQLAGSRIFVLRFRADKQAGHFPSGKVLSISIVVHNMPDLLVCVHVDVGRNGLAPVPLPPEFFKHMDGAQSKGSDVFPTHPKLFWL